MNRSSPKSQVAGAIFCLALLSQPCLGEPFKIPHFWSSVIDEGQLLSGDEAERLRWGIRDYYNAGGADIGVLTVRNLGGEDIAALALRAAETWRLGRPGKDDGVVIVVSREDRRIRIEVGYGLEGDLPDAKANRILEEQMQPHFLSGNFGFGLSEGLRSIAAAATPAIPLKTLVRPTEDRFLEGIDDRDGQIFSDFEIALTKIIRSVRDRTGLYVTIVTLHKDPIETKDDTLTAWKNWLGTRSGILIMASARGQEKTKDHPYLSVWGHPASLNDRLQLTKTREGAALYRWLEQEEELITLALGEALGSALPDFESGQMQDLMIQASANTDQALWKKIQAYAIVFVLACICLWGLYLLIRHGPVKNPTQRDSSRGGRSSSSSGGSSRGGGFGGGGASGKW